MENNLNNFNEINGRTEKAFCRNAPEEAQLRLENISKICPAVCIVSVDSER
jgi:hypothetical protein